MVGQSQTLQMKQAQTLAMTPQMQQSLKILQLSSIELNDLLERELENNPLLEKADSFDNDSSDLENNEKDFTEPENKQSDSENQDFEKIVENFDVSNNDDNSDNDELYSHESSSNSGKESFDISEIIEKTYSKEQDLSEFITDQINIEFNDPKKKFLAFGLTDLLDNSGYLDPEKHHEEIEDLIAKSQTDWKILQDVLERLKEFEPSGIFSKNLNECLKKQLLEIDRLDPLMVKFIDNLDLIAKGEITRLSKICKCDNDEIKDMLNEVKALNPRPSANFSTTQFNNKYPDLNLYKENGEWQLEINNDYLPNITINKNYYENLKKNKLSKDEKSFLRENYSSANFIVRAVNQRAKSILRVAAAIIAKQQEFFDKGINYLKPVTMKEIAELVELHESTVGRVVANKFMATPIGIFELKFFFTQALSSTDGGEDFSSESAKNQIKELIENEDKILSDEKISKILKDKGIQCARRTVAKYREQMGIPTSSERKRLRKIKEL
jgi:RNA polymerase sigma-54 factor